MKRCIAMVMALVFGAVSLFGCVKPTSTNTAKMVISKAGFYMGLAQTLIVLAKTHYKDNAKVKVALAATEKALVALQNATLLVESGLDKDYGLLGAKLTDLMTAIFELNKAIQEARSAS